MAGKMKPHKIIIKCIQAGGATEQTLIEAAGLHDLKALNAQFKVLREYFDLYPILQDDGTYQLLDEDAYNKHESVLEQQKAQRQARKKYETEVKKILEKNPQKKLNDAIVRRENALNRLDSATIKASKLPQDQLLQLKKEKAGIDFRIADYELAQLIGVFCRLIRVTKTELENLRAIGELNAKVNAIFNGAITPTDENSGQ